MRCFFLLLIILPFSGSAQHIAAKADSLLSAYYNQGKFTGTVLIAQHDRILFEKGYGYADNSKHIPNTVNTEYRIGSITKQFTATIIMKLREMGKLSLQDPLSLYIPDYPKGDSILVKHLLNHTSGIKSFTSMKQYYTQWMKEAATPEKLISYFKHEPLLFRPGSDYAYSNSNYLLLTFIAEKSSGKKLHVLLNEYIFKKLNLQHTQLDSNNRASANKALGYVFTPESDYTPAPFIDISILSGAGAMYSTVHDLYKWDRALYTSKILSDTSLQQMFTPGLKNYGYAWEIRNNNGRKEISHAGSTDGFLANIIRYPEQDICIIFLSNYGDSKAPQICKALTALISGDTYEVPKAKKIVQVADTILNSYTGQYMLGNSVITISSSNGKLMGKLGDQAPFTLLAESDSTFFIRVVELEIEFVKERERVTALKLKQGTKETVWKRLP